MGCCVSRPPHGEGASGSTFDDVSSGLDPLGRPRAPPLGVDDEALSAVVRDVYAELAGDIRRALAPALRRARPGRALADEYDESDARVLGKGAFSVVYVVRHKRTGESRAAKVVATRGFDDERRRDVVRAILCEAGVAAAAPHDTVVRFHDLIFEADRVILVQEYCRGGTLLQMVQREVDDKRRERRAAAAEAAAAEAAAARRAPRPSGDFDATESESDGAPARADWSRRGEAPARAAESAANPGGGGSSSALFQRARDEAAARVMTSRGGALRERDAASAARRIVGALAHLHAAGFVHRDVKLENLLLATPGDYGTLKLADFGFATRACDAAGYRDAAFERRDEKGDGLRGTAEYAAPEVLADLGGPAGGGGNEKEKKKEKEKEKEKRARREESKDPGRRSGDSRASSDAAAEARRRGRSSRDSGEGGPRGRGGPRSARAEVDVWSFGVTAFLMLAGYHPFDASREAYSARMRMDATLAKEFAKPAWASVSEDAKRVLRETLRSDPKKRTDARALTKDPWIASSR